MKQRKSKFGIQCLKCLDILVSKFTHDFQECKCYNGKQGCFIDGGDSYARIGGSNYQEVWVNRETGKIVRRIK